MINKLVRTLSEINSNYDVISINADQEMLLLGLKEQLTAEEQTKLPEHTEYRCEVTKDSTSGYPFIILFPFQFAYLEVK
tara:strand:- start:656 stop:892 length:237 start_codon:yes stop_codon:yes gene_type:complete